MITSLIIAIIFTIILSYYVHIKRRDVVIICCFSALVVYLLNTHFDVNNKITNILMNSSFPFQKQRNNFASRKINLSSSKKECSNLMGCPIERLTPRKYGEIIPEDMYNPEDCTNDLSCIQKPDENNLFVGFTGNSETKKKIKNLSFNIAKMENNIKNMKDDDGIYVETFQNNRSPEELNDLILPYNKQVIKPYESKPKVKNNLIPQEMMETDGICFHGKVGYCIGGNCRGDKDQNVEGTTTHTVEQSTMALSAHPYTDEQPLIRITNPGQHDFE